MAFSSLSFSPKTDVKDVRVVVNFDFPSNCEDYVHRIGATEGAAACSVGCGRIRRSLARVCAMVGVEKGAGS